MRCKLRDFVALNQKSYTAKLGWKYLYYLDTGNITKNVVDSYQKFSIPDKAIPSRAKRLVKNGTIIYSTVRPNQLHYGLLENIPNNLLVSTGFTTIDVNPKFADERYVFYFLTQESITKSLHALAEQSVSTYPSIKADDIGDIEIDLPPLETQKKISKLVSSIDEKIKLNKEINDNLANQVKSLYEDIINDLDIENLPPGFKLITLSDIAEVQSGKRPNSRTEKSDEINIYPLVGAASIMGFTNNYNFDEKILITGRVGTHGVIQRFSSPCWASDNTLIITSNYYEFTSQVLQHIDYRSMNRGSTQPLITQSDLKKKQIILPDLDTLNRFEKTASSLMTLYDQNLINNKELAELRDSLLPKLMSGEIDVDSIEL